MPRDAIGILIDLARKGEIDPWDLDVVQLTDRFLQSLGRLESADLGKSAQAILYASVLVHMKAEALEMQAQQPFAPPVEEDVEGDQLDLWGSETLIPLERRLRRRAAAPAMDKRPLTLGDLIAHLKEVEQIERQQARVRVLHKRQTLNGPTITTFEQVEQLAHQENLEVVVSGLLVLLVRLGDTVGFEHLLEHYEDRVGAFLGLLFLAHRSQVALTQAEFYRDILIYVVEPEGAIGSSPLS